MFCKWFLIYSFKTSLLLISEFQTQLLTKIISAGLAEFILFLLMNELFLFLFCHEIIILMIFYFVVVDLWEFKFEKKVFVSKIQILL